jgi:hypothetical protein
MRIAKTDIPARIQVPGAIARQALDFGDATGYGKIAGDDLFCWPPGHTVKVGQDAEIIPFSPQAEHCRVVDHLHRQLVDAGG